MSLNSQRGQSVRENPAQNKEKRVALIIGNSAYSVKPLPNPVNDAIDLGAVLNVLGFSVTVKKDLNHEQMIRAIQAFGAQIKNGGVGLFYYAGHAAQVDGENYLLPVDTLITKKEEISAGAVNVRWALAQMESAGNPLNIVILDACRDNPFVGGSRSGQRGLAAVTDIPVGTYISYSTAANKTASDGSGRNSPYTESLLRHIRTSGLRVEDVFKRVRNEVRVKTKGEQVPWEYSSIEGDFYFARIGSAPSASATPVLPSREDVQPETPDEEIVNGIAIPLVRIPAGRFLMGSSDNEANRRTDEGPQHDVTISRSFYMGKYEVTQLQWRVVSVLPRVKIELNAGPSYFTGDNLPVEQVSWDEAVEFCERLSRASGKRYRLPSEAEWEYACRAGTTTSFAFGQTISAERVNHDAKYGVHSAPDGLYRGHTVGVGSLGIANAFGLYDMHGNVWEWCMDWYSEGYYRQSPSTDPMGPGIGSLRVIRGGSYDDYPENVRSAFRKSNALSADHRLVGFRIVSPTS